MSTDKEEQKNINMYFQDDSDVPDDDELEELLAMAKDAVSKAPRPLTDGQDSNETETHWSKGFPNYDPGPDLPKPYFTDPKQRATAPTLTQDPEINAVQESLISGPKPSTNLDLPGGVKLTKKQRKEMKSMTAGPDWFDLPAPSAADLPRLHKEVEALRLRRAMDPKLRTKNEPGEGKGIKGLPKYFAIGKVVENPTPFKTRSASNLTRKERKKTLVEELLADTTARSYAKRKFDEFEASRTPRWKRKDSKKQR
ncbi:hypothetical protein FRB99_001062 [Tulasnella sp. 403]|nr:hypothetical protein FRB99_001062 [Tulasnella sp. 403]